MRWRREPAGAMWRPRPPSCLHQRARMFQILCTNCVSRPIGQCCDRARGVVPAFCGNTVAPVTNRLRTQSQLCRYRLTALVLGSVPMMAPPRSLRGLVFGHIIGSDARFLLQRSRPHPLHDVKLSEVLRRLISLSWKSKVIRSTVLSVLAAKFGLRIRTGSIVVCGLAFE